MTRSEDAVDFHLTAKTVNVVSVESLEEAVRHANVATQTVGISPGQRSAKLRDALAAMGVQRVVALGEVAKLMKPYQALCAKLKSNSAGDNG